MAQICNPPGIYIQPASRSTCAGFSVSFDVIASFPMGYQWQVDTGSGFVDMVNNGTYTDVTANSMTVYNVTPAMDGYVFRAIVLGSSPTCYSVSANAILHVTPLSANAVLTNPTCSGGTNGLIDLTVSGGSGLYGYYWPSTTGWSDEPDLVNASAGTYTVTFEDDMGCTGEATYTLTQPSPITVSGVALGNPYCHGMTNGYVEVSSSGGTGSHTYLWSPSGQTGTTASGLGGGIHTVTVTDANGCTETMSFTLVEPQPLQATVTKTDISCNGLTDGTASVSATGGPASFSYSYQWSGVGSNYPSVNGLHAGNYTVNVYAGMCSVTQPFTISEPDALTSAVAAFTNLQCNNASDGSATVTADGGTGSYTFSWSTSSETTGHAADLPAGLTEVTITDQRGCTSMQSFTLTEPSPLVLAIDSIHAPTCYTSSDGALYIEVTGGTPTNTAGFPHYTATMPTLPATASDGQTWPEGNMIQYLTGLTAGSYAFTFEDASGCTAAITVPVTAPDSIVVTLVSLENASCHGLDDGSATVAATGGVGALTFHWDSGTISPVNDQLSAGDFTVYAMDENNCSSSYIVTISEPSALTLTVDSIHTPTCYNASDGALYIEVTGGTPINNAGSSYYTTTLPVLPATASSGQSWPEGNMIQYITGLTANSYAFTFEDANGCTASITVPVANPDSIVVTVVSLENVSCHGLDNGSAEVAATGGVGDLTFHWDSGTISPVNDQLSAGDITVYATDENNCSSQYTNLTISEPSQLVTDSVVNHVSCYGGSDGSMAFTASGGTAPYTIDYNGPNEGLPSAYYPVSVTDANGCVINTGVSIDQPDAIVFEETFNRCAGDSIVIAGVAYFENTVVEQVYTSMNGCDSTYHASLSFTDINTDITEQDGTWYLDFPQSATFQWMDCGTGQPVAGATSNAFVPPYSGSFAAAIAYGDCSETTECREMAYAGLGENPSLHAGLFPNPSNGTFTVRWNEGITDAVLTVTDISGKILYHTTTNSGHSQVIDLHETAGVYYVTISSGSTRQVLKAVLN